MHETIARIVGHNLRGDRQRDDFYATPEACTRALLGVETFTGPVWEPCCGEGHIARVLVSGGHEVVSTDLVDRGYGVTGIDALMVTASADLFVSTTKSRTFPNVVTNPPFRNALEFAEHFTDQADKVALLLKLNFLEGVKRREFFKRKPPVRVHVFSARQALMKNGNSYEGRGGMMALAWFVWERNNCEPPRVGWI